MDVLNVFISGTQIDLGPERKAVERAVHSIKWKAVCAEAYGSQPMPSRATCQEMVGRSDIYLGLYGGRYGWVIPADDLSVTEFEFNEARRMGKPMLVYVKDVPPEQIEPRQAAFLKRVEDFDTGFFRRPRFTSTQELGEWVQEDLAQLVKRLLAERAAEKPAFFVNVPALPNHFLGRDDLVHDLIQRLLAGASPALSAQGLPGVGKTALAVFLAHHRKVLDHFSDGILWASLGPTPDVMSVLAAWGDALGVDVTDKATPQTRAQAVHNAIGQRCLLLVIDDVWDIEVARLFRCSGPRCSHLLTTRDQAIARAFAGPTQTVSVPVLADQPAFQLLQTIAPEACAADPAASRQLAETVGGLPLALELLGGYLAAPEYAIFPELSQEALADLASPARRLQLAQHRLGAQQDKAITLQEVIALSLEHLPQPAVAAFYALGAFAPKPATFDRLAAEAVTGADAATLATIVARSLVEQAGPETLALHQTVADVARTGTPPQAVARHRDYYLAEVKADPEDWQRIEAIYPQIRHAWGTLLADEPLCKSQDRRVAIDFALALRHFFAARGYWQEGQERLGKAIVASKRIPDRAAQAKLGLALGLILFRQDKFQEAKRQLESSLRLSRQIEDTVTEQKSLYNLGFRSADGPEAAPQRYKDALILLQESLELAQALSESAWTAVVMSKQQIAKCCTLLQHYDEAATHLQECHEIYESKGIHDERLQAHTHYFLGLNFHWQNRLPEARCHYEQDLKISYGQGWESIYAQGPESSERPKDPVHVGEVLANLAEVICDQGHPKEAQALLHHARKYAEMFQNKMLIEYLKGIQEKIDRHVDTSVGDGHETKESSS